MNRLDTLITEAKAANTAYREYDDTEERLLRDRYTYARRQLFLAIVEELVTHPATTLTELSERLGEDPRSMPNYVGQEITSWLYDRLYKEKA